MNRAERRRLSKEAGTQPVAPAPGSIISQALRDEAINAHRDGRVADAVAMLNRYLAQQPDDALGHHAIGLALRDLGNIDRALHHIQRSLALAPRDPIARNNLGGIYSAMERWADARQAFEGVLAVRPDWALPWRNLGAVLLALGVMDQSLRALTRAIELAPNDALAHYHMGQAAMKLNDSSTAILAFGEALTLDPKNLAFATTLADLSAETGEFQRALAVYKHALLHHPDDVRVIAALATRLTHAGMPEDALILLNHAREIAPGDPRCLTGLAWAWRSLGDPQKAIGFCREVLAADDRHVEAQFLLGNLEMEEGHLETARHCFERVMALAPDHIDAGSNDAYLTLMQGDFAEGWRKFERRLRLPAFRYFHHEGPRWNGEPLEGRTILIEAEQGFGDSLQFLRYVPMVAARASRVLLRVPPMMIRLLTRLPENVTFVSWEERGQAFDYRIEMMSLALVFGTELDAIPVPIPYLSVDPALIDTWRARLASSEGMLRVGLVWAGNPDHQNDCNRSMPLDAVEPLTHIDGVQLFSLQVGPRAKDLARLPDSAIEDLSPLLTDFAETAAALSVLDLLIAVDTSVVHLAGALGRPAWLLLSTVSEWRWLLGRSDSPWYPSLRLFRQTAYRDWAAVIAEVGTALNELPRSAPQLSQ